MKKKFNLEGIKVPHTYVILCTLILLAAVLTYVVPAGVFDRVKSASGSMIADPNSFHYVEAQGISLMTLLSAPYKGMLSVADLIFFVFVTGGSFQIITSTGTIEAGVNKIAVNLKGREKFMIPIFVGIFSLFGTLIGMTTESLVFIPLGIALCRRVGYDALVGTGMIVLGCYVGFVSGAVNPYNVGVAQGIADLPMFSGMGLRLVLHVVLWIATSLAIMKYAEKIRKSPKMSVVYELECVAENDNEENIDINTKLTKRNWMVITVVIIGFAILVNGVIKYGWGIENLAPVFLGMGIIAGVVGGLSPSKIAKEFVNGAKTMVFGALVIGVARGILEVLNTGMILDTIVMSLGDALQKLPPQLTAIGMYFVHVIINFFIPSGSGQAAVTMPVMVPLGDMVGVSRQCSVLAFQLGDGFTNAINPTSSTINAAISISGTSLVQWIRFAAPIVGMQMLIGLGFLVFATMTGY